MNGMRSGRSAIRQKSYVRRVSVRPKHVRSRVKYDEIDNSALQRMEKLRVDWDTREDNILLVCKVAMMYLCPKPRRQMIGFTSVRDVLRSYSVTSYNKTSRACQRRLLYMLKKADTHHSVTLGVEELKQDFYVDRRFGNKLEQLKREYWGTHKYYEQVNLVFRDLVNHIANRYYDISDIGRAKSNATPRTIEQFHLFNRVKRPRRPGGVTSFSDDTSNDIHSSTINSVIHSSMCCVKDRRSWAYQLFRIYQQYPEWLLRSAMAKIRTDQMVTIKKNYAFAIRKQSNACMPMSSSQYQLSSSYVQKFNTKFPYTAFNEAFHFFNRLANHYDEFESRVGTVDEPSEMITCPVNGGTLAAIHDYVNVDALDFDVEIPRHIIKLDPTLQKDDEKYIRIARRYQDLLRNLDHVDVDGILETEASQGQVPSTLPVDDQLLGESSTTSPQPVDAPVAESIRLKNKQPGDAKSPMDSKDSSRCRENEDESANCSDNNLEPRKTISQVSKSQDSHETNLNATDFEREPVDDFFDDEDDCCYDELEEQQQDDEDDDLICFIDGTKIRLTAEDIENSGFEAAKSSRRKNPEEEVDHSKMDVEPCSGEQPKKASEELNDKDVLVDKSDWQIMDVDLSPDQRVLDQSSRDPVTDYVRVNRLIDQSKSEQFDRSSYRRTCESSNDMQKRYTRLAMLQMREELTDLASSESHHAHEFFVLNMFKIYYSFRRSIIERPIATGSSFSDHSASQQPRLSPNELLSRNRQSYSAIIADLKKFAIFPKAAATAASYYKFRQNLSETDLFKRGMDGVYEFIRDRREVGASLSQLSVRFDKQIENKIYES